MSESENKELKRKALKVVIVELLKQIAEIKKKRVKKNEVSFLRV